MKIVAPYRPIRARDGFAGVGWGVACQSLGIDEFGFDIEPNVVATRTANGMLTPGRDLWLPDEVLSDYDLGIDSPPCQTFSMAGKGTGRKALDDVLRAIDARRYLSIDSLKALGDEVGDLRTALVLTPLFYAARDVPETIVLEQVPSVLPVWERIADELRSWGYSAATAVLNAEQYGVPQTRKRAILIARINGIAKMPTPTHSRFYGNDPTRLDPGVKKWVSMAEALGWESSEGVEFVSNDKLPHASRRPVDAPAPTITAGHDTANRVWEYGHLPATTVLGDSRVAPRGHHDNNMKGAIRVTVEEAAALQSFPQSMDWSAVSQTAAYKIIGNAVPPLLAEVVLREALDL